MDNLPKASRISLQFRRNFVTGLLVLAPVWITLYLVAMVVQFLGGFVSPYLRQVAISLLGEDRWPTVVGWVSDFIGFLITIALIAVAGALVRRVVGKRLLQLLHRALARIPVIREVYDGINKFLQLLFGDKSGFQRVVAVQFPNDNTWSIGFMTNSNQIALSQDSREEFITVFVPHTPNATSGFTIFTKTEKTRSLELSVDEALRIVISGGTLSPRK